MGNTPRIRRKSCAGMTLLDVAVALVIVSFLFTGVVRGSELISSAQTKRISAEISNVTAAFLTYQDRYRSIPGDDANAAARWSGAKNGNGDGVLSGHYDDQAPLNASAFIVDRTQGESLNIWWHLRLAGVLTGPDFGADAATPPMHVLADGWAFNKAPLACKGRYCASMVLRSKWPLRWIDKPTMVGSLLHWPLKKRPPADRVHNQKIDISTIYIYVPENERKKYPIGVRLSARLALVRDRIKGSMIKRKEPTAFEYPVEPTL